MKQDYLKWVSNMNNVKRDRYGFIDLSKGFSIGTRKHSMDVFEHDSKIYYFKEIAGGRASGFFRNFALDNPYILAEVINGRFYKNFGVQAVEYFPAKHSGCTGVISRSYTDEYGAKYAQTLREYLNREKYGLETNKSLKELNNYKVITKTEKSFQEQLQMASLLHLGTGQYDGHVANMAVKLDRDSLLASDLILFDNCLCTPAGENFCDLRAMYGENHDLFNKLGLSKCTQNLEEYYKELESTDLISTDVIKRYLEILDYQLRDDKFFRNIKEETLEETGARIDNKYLDKLKFVLEATGERISQAYDNRIIELGE